MSMTRFAPKLSACVTFQSRSSLFGRLLHSKVEWNRTDTADKVPGLLWQKPTNAASPFGIIVVQEWWGVNDSIKKIAAHVSKSLPATHVLVPDLYRGKIGVDKEEAHHLFSHLDWPGAVKDIGSAANYLRAQGCKKVGVVGFCMGGALSLGAAISGSVDASVVCYGYNPGLGDASKIKVPVQLNFGKLDKMAGFSDPETAKKLADLLKSGNVAHELHLYENADHAFLNFPDDDTHRTRKMMGFHSYNEEAATLAWTNIFRFFKTHLQ